MPDDPAAAQLNWESAYPPFDAKAAENATAAPAVLHLSGQTLRAGTSLVRRNSAGATDIELRITVSEYNWPR